MADVLRCATVAERLDSQLVVGVDAQIGGDVQRALDDVACRQFGVLEQRTRGGLCVGAAGADGQQALLGLEHVAVAGDDQRVLGVGHRKHRLQAAQHAIGAPVLGQLDCGAHELAAVFLELGLEALEQRERVGGAAGEAGQHAVVVQAADFARAGLDHDVAKGDLAVAAKRDLAPSAHADDGGAVILLHESVRAREAHRAVLEFRNDAARSAPPS